MSALDIAECDVAVIGAGVVGLAVARALALAGREVLVLEAEHAIGTITSSRNSEVIHAGMYYAAGSLMAKFCVRGRHLLYDYCASHGVGHRKCGKLIVACDQAEIAKLVDITKRAAVNGVDDLRQIDVAQAQALEPALSCTGALLSPSTGIVDSHGLMLAYLGDAQDHGAALALNAPVTRGSAREDGRVELEVGGAEPMKLVCRTVINAAGLDAPVVASGIEGLRPEAIPKRYFAKGSYYALLGRNPFSRLIYPVPIPGGLGVHLTIDLAGQARFGPDVEWVDALNYDVDPRRADSFYAAVRRYWPGLKDGALVPAYSGIRPKIVPQGAPGQDFILQDANVHGVSGLVNLLGIESPGLTSSLAIAEAVAAMVKD